MMQDEHGHVMKELVEWLVKMEQLAGDTYRRLAEALTDEPGLHAFISELANQEDLHAEMMQQISPFAQDMAAHPPSEIRLERSSRQRIEAPLKRMRQAIADGSINAQKAANAIAEVEFSEWNDIFLYVVRRFRDVSRDAQYMAATIQEHESGVRKFIANLPPDLQPESPYMPLEPIWEVNLLVVEDNPIFRDTVAGILETFGRVAVAEDGKAALAALKNCHFDAIVSDIQMPRMTGLELYNNAAASLPNLKHRFVFMSFSPLDSELKYMAENKLAFLQKPFDPYELKDAVGAILSGEKNDNPIEDEPNME